MGDTRPPVETVQPAELSPAILVVAATLLREATSKLDGADSATESTLTPESIAAIQIGSAALELVGEPGMSMAEAVRTLLDDKKAMRQAADTLEALETGVDPDVYTQVKRIEELRDFCSDGDLAISSLEKGEVITIAYVNGRDKEALLTISRISDSKESGNTALDYLVVVNRVVGKHLESGLYDLEEGAIILLGYQKQTSIISRLLRGSHPAWVTNDNLYLQDGEAYLKREKQDTRFTLNQIYYGTDRSIPLFPEHSE